MKEPALIDHLRTQLQQPLPGPEAQYKMAHVGRPAHPATPSDARKAGVMALFYPGSPTTGWHLVLIERVQKHGDRHSGQVSFPGGKHEPQDRDLWATALRETEEEVGVPQHSVERLGALTPLYIPVSHFEVHPYVAFTLSRPNFRPQASEVAEILEVPFADLTDPSTRKITDLPINYAITLRDIPYFDVHQRIVWGATAMMLNELLELVGRL